VELKKSRGVEHADDQRYQGTPGESFMKTSKSRVGEQGMKEKSRELKENGKIQRRLRKNEGDGRTLRTLRRVGKTRKGKKVPQKEKEEVGEKTSAETEKTSP